MDRIASRRLEASICRVAQRRLAVRMELTDPKFNLREIIKQMVLLEDHLSHPYKACPDCIRKHLMTIEAFAEEGVALDPIGELASGMEAIAERSRRWMETVIDGAHLPLVCTDVRRIRKGLVPMVCDPRDQTDRVASRQISKLEHLAGGGWHDTRKNPPGAPEGVSYVPTSRNMIRDWVNLIYKVANATVPESSIWQSSLRHRYPDTNYTVYVSVETHGDLVKLANGMKQAFESRKIGGTIEGRAILQDSHAGDKDQWVLEIHPYRAGPWGLKVKLPEGPP